MTKNRLVLRAVFLGTFVAFILLFVPNISFGSFDIDNSVNMIWVLSNADRFNNIFLAAAFVGLVGLALAGAIIALGFLHIYRFDNIKIAKVLKILIAATYIIILINAVLWILGAVGYNRRWGYAEGPWVWLPRLTAFVHIGTYLLFAPFIELGIFAALKLLKIGTINIETTKASSLQTIDKNHLIYAISGLIISLTTILAFVLPMVSINVGLANVWRENFFSHFVSRFNRWSQQTLLQNIVILFGFSAIAAAIFLLFYSIKILLGGGKVFNLRRIMHVLGALAMLVAVANLVYILTFNTNMGPLWYRPTNISLGIGGFLMFAPFIIVVVIELILYFNRKNIHIADDNNLEIDAKI